jgi:nicotinate phosphoribosyltransferase
MSARTLGAVERGWRETALLTDLYELTMLQAYLEHGFQDTAVFEFFVRKLPAERNFLVAAGLEQALDYLTKLRFTPAELDGLAASGRFSQAFLDHLARLRFTGDVHALPEGTVFFPDEPVIRVTAPMAEAQLVESRLINILHFQTLIASKAARMVLSAPGKLLVDFGLRRAHGAEAGLLAARAAYVAGFAGSATVLAEAMFGVPAFGTMAHSFIQAHDDETTAFEHFARSHPGNVVLLIDTYDTEAGARKVVELAPRLARDGITVRAVRLDSGDMVELAHKVRRILDDGGLPETRIFASGSIDEHELKRYAATGAPIDGCGIGTLLTTSADLPYLDCAYKLTEYAGVARRKRSTGKATWPGRKQVFRTLDGAGRLDHDRLTVEGDPQPGTALIQPVMRAGERLKPPEPLATIRERAARGLAQLPEALKAVDPAAAYRVEVAPALRALADAVDARMGGAG